MAMQQFKKWWTKHNPEGEIESFGFKWDGEVWEAALEWALSLKSANGLCESCFSDINSNDIKKELGDEQDSINTR